MDVTLSILCTSALELFHLLEEAHPNSMILDFLVERVQETQLVSTKFDPMRRGSVINYQQQHSSEYLISNFTDTKICQLRVTRNIISLHVCPMYKMHKWRSLHSQRRKSRSLKSRHVCKVPPNYGTNSG